jgi:membrane protein DedA with SNARE-associated domain
MDEQDLDDTTRWFRRHGTTAVLVGRLVPGIRSLISIPAGVTHMAIGKFCAYTALGSLVWNTVLIGAGWVLGREWHRVEAYTGVLEVTVIIAAVVLACTYLWRRRDRIRNFAR